MLKIEIRFNSGGPTTKIPYWYQGTIHTPLREDLIQWINEQTFVVHVSTKFHWVGKGSLSVPMYEGLMFEFENEQDALLFKLVWL